MCGLLLTESNAVHNYESYSFSTSSETALGIVSFGVATLLLVGWYLTEVLIGISLMTNDVEHPFVCLLAICTSLEKISVQTCCPFLSCITHLLLLNCKSSLYLMATGPLLYI